MSPTAHGDVFPWIRLSRRGNHHRFRTLCQVGKWKKPQTFKPQESGFPNNTANYWMNDFNLG